MVYVIIILLFIVGSTCLFIGIGKLLAQKGLIKSNLFFPQKKLISEKKIYKKWSLKSKSNFFIPEMEIRLQQCISEQTYMRVVYWGGTQPGESRIIYPLSINSNKVTARCMNSNKIKTFFISKLQVSEF